LQKSFPDSSGAMTGSLLHVTVSPRGGASHSRRIGQRLISRLQAAAPVQVLRRDLAQAPVPYPGKAFVDASLAVGAACPGPNAAALALSEALIAELAAADLLVIDTPMHNFTIPAALKSWIDHVVRPARTFRSTAAGKKGLLPDRPVFVVIACGGPVSDDGTGQTDFLTPYLRYVMATIGLRDFHALRLDGLGRGEDAVRRAEAAASDWIAAKSVLWKTRRPGGSRPFRPSAKPISRSPPVPT
jgi:FMN-dependent NADH-azoreductase